MIKNKSPKPQVIEKVFPPQGDLMMKFELVYHDGSHDHSREGRRFDSITLADGRILSSFEFDKESSGELSYDKMVTRTGRYETATETIKLSANLELPVLINVTEVDEYHPDYYNEFGGRGEDEFKPTINNREVVIRVVKTSPLGG